ncbi:MAG: hypothetical protein MUO24_02180 [Desulfobacterales bacterium]|nr:hypothetical protein [Desulfobacterales bacterium]
MAIEGLPELNALLKSMPEKVLKNVEKILNINARVLQRYIRTEKMTGGTTESRLRARSGHLRASVIPIKAERKGDTIESGVSIGKVYARTHIGPVGQKTTITPKKGKFLTIPLPAALKPSGDLKGPARSDIWGETFIAKSKKGNLIIFGKGRIMKGKRAGELRGQVVPLFLLVKSVTVKARIHPSELLDWIKPKVIEDFSSGKFKVI